MCRPDRVLLRAAVVLMIAVTLSLGMATTAAAADLAPPLPASLPNPCDSILGTVGPGALACGALDTASGVVGVVGDVGAQIAVGVIDAFAEWVAAGLASMLETVGRAIFSGPEVDLFATGEGGTWFVHHYDKMAAIGLAIFAPMLILAVLHAVVIQSWGLLSRAVANLPIAALGTAVAVTVTQLLLVVTDAASNFLASNLADDSQNFLEGVISFLLQPAAVSPGVAAFPVILVGLFLAFVSFVVWLELLVRQAAIYLTVLFLPLGFATHIWPALSSWLRRLIEVIVALILSKLVIVAALSLAGSALANQEGFPALVAASGMMLLAAFAPFALFKLIPIASLAATSSLEGQGRRAARAGSPRLSTAYYLGALNRGRGAAARAPTRAANTGAGPGGGRPGGPPPPTLGPAGGPAGLPTGGGATGAAKAGGATGAAKGAGAAGAVAAGPAGVGAAAAVAGSRAASAQVRTRGREAVDTTISATEGDK